MNDIYSFYQLISKYQIEIPIIQRDYAQGRKDPKAKDVRKSMVENLIKSVTENKSPLFFDFVYGRIDGNTFIPFDGQQRLTTLFLFHKYIFEKCQSCSTCEYKFHCICKDILLRFSYVTRQSSREFCEQLVSNSIIPSKDYYNRIRDEYISKLSEKLKANHKEKLEADLKKKTDEFVANKADWMSSYIKNQSWFYSDWEKDPTIVGMLTMLDEIHNLLTKKETNDYKPLAEKLTSGCNCPITFHFVDMGEHKLSDETYVKMNARGKSLTPFENFKASLEQYLGDKDRKDLLSRLKENVDGKWLDLFWNVVNKDNRDGEKELPDSTMMCFINRHFMNVWRCWYGQNKESDNERFNQRIIADMPLYPTKDDFVSWEIYQNVLDNCGINECLTPIFNIWDKLSDEQNNIVENSQAVWNRRGNKKWNLYEGAKNKDNRRETYPSRVTFYALLRYFEKEEIGTTLAQWMRVVWNIIENSTIDSSDTYQSALSLIDKLSKNCDDIYDALANHFDDFKLGSQYHAQNQVKEEIAKAEQIRQGNLRADEKSREDVIIEAESYAFFKGAIRFLFTDREGNINWCDFDAKWKNAQKYFDEGGVKDEEKKYKTEAILLKAVLFNVEDFWKYVEPQKYVFDNKAETWKSNILLENGWENAVHQIFMGNLDIKPREGDSLIYKNLYNSNLLVYLAKEMAGSRIRRIHDHRAIYPPYYEGIILDDDDRNNKFHRNQILSSDSRIHSGQRIKELDFYKGWDINFEYEGRTFQWNTDEKVYLMENGKRKSKNENDSYYTDVTNLSDSNELIEKLDYLITLAYPKESEKSS